MHGKECQGTQLALVLRGVALAQPSYQKEHGMGAQWLLWASKPLPASSAAPHDA